MDKQQEKLAAVLEKYGVSSINEKWYDGQTALMKAVCDADAESAVLLLENGADIEIKDRNQRTALFIAVELKKKDMVGLLLDYGADIDTQNETGANPLGYLWQMERDYRGTETGKLYTEIKDILEAKLEQRFLEQKKAAPTKSKRPPTKHWKL